MRWNNAYEQIIDRESSHSDGIKLFKKLVENGDIIIGLDDNLVKDAEAVREGIQNVVDNKGMYVFCNNKGKESKRGPIACSRKGVPHEANLEVLRIRAPEVHKAVQRIIKAYKDSGKDVYALWLTYYRKDIKKHEALWIKLGEMVPHRDRFPGSDRIILTLFDNSSGGQKRMLFRSKRNKKHKVWIKINHGMFVCLSRQGGGVDQFENDTIQHGIDGAIGTWTVTLEFQNQKKR